MTSLQQQHNQQLLMPLAAAGLGGSSCSLNNATWPPAVAAEIAQQHSWEAELNYLAQLLPNDDATAAAACPPLLSQSSSILLQPSAAGCSRMSSALPTSLSGGDLVQLLDQAGIRAEAGGSAPLPPLLQLQPEPPPPPELTLLPGLPPLPLPTWPLLSAAGGQRMTPLELQLQPEPLQLLPELPLTLPGMGSEPDHHLHLLQQPGCPCCHPAPLQLTTSATATDRAKALELLQADLFPVMTTATATASGFIGEAGLEREVGGSSSAWQDTLTWMEAEAEVESVAPYAYDHLNIQDACTPHSMPHPFARYHSLEIEAAETDTDTDWSGGEEVGKGVSRARGRPTPKAARAHKLWRSQDGSADVGLEMLRPVSEGF